MYQAQTFLNIAYPKFPHLPSFCELVETWWAILISERIYRRRNYLSSAEFELRLACAVCDGIYCFAQRPNKKMKEESYFLPLSENICPMSIFQRISCVITSLKGIRMCWIHASIDNIEQTHDISSIWRINVWIWLGILSACQGFVDIENTQHLWKIRGL